MLILGAYAWEMGCVFLAGAEVGTVSKWTNPG